MIQSNYNVALEDVKTWFNGLPLEHKNLCFTEVQKAMGVVGSDGEQEYGDDERYKSNGYILARLTAKEYNRLIARGTIHYEIKFWYNFKKNGYDYPNLDLASHISDQAFKKFKNAKAEINNDLRVVSGVIRCEQKLFISCAELITLNIEVC